MTSREWWRREAAFWFDTREPHRFEFLWCMTLLMVFIIGISVLATVNTIAGHGPPPAPDCRSTPPERNR